MNVMRYWPYVTDGDLASFGGKKKREEAWDKDGWLGKYIRQLGMTVRVNSTVFFHGGGTDN
jgi:hypothetical protein